LYAGWTLSLSIFALRLLCSRARSPRQIVVVDSVPNLGAVEYGFVIVAAGIAAGLVLVTRARRRDNAIAMNYARTSAASVAHSTQACELSASLTGP